MLGRRLETTGNVYGPYGEDCFEPRTTQILLLYTHPSQAVWHLPTLSLPRQTLGPWHPPTLSLPRPALGPWDAPLPWDRSP